MGHTETKNENPPILSISASREGLPPLNLSIKWCKHCVIIYNIPTVRSKTKVTVLKTLINHKFQTGQQLLDM